MVVHPFSSTLRTILMRYLVDDDIEALGITAYSEALPRAIRKSTPPPLRAAMPVVTTPTCQAMLIRTQLHEPYLLAHPFSSPELGSLEGLSRILSSTLSA